MRLLLLLILGQALTSPSSLSAQEPTQPAAKKPPNILFAIADDWGWPHAGAYGDPVVKTPTFDRLAGEGVLFRNAFVSSPSCTPSRGAILTGQWHWRLGAAANLWSVFPDRCRTYPEILQEAGYHTGSTSKGWGPGKTETPGRQPAGPGGHRNLEEFIASVPEGQPWCFWLGSHDPHRGFDEGSGARSGIDVTKIRLFEHFPDCQEIRSDVADYYLEVQRFDSLVATAIAQLESRGLLDNTIVVMTGDHGMPFPRCKSNNYDSGARVPLAIRWPEGFVGTREAGELVSLVDLAPTFLEAAGVSIPADFSGHSLLPLLTGRDDVDRSFVLHGKDRHVPAQEAPSMGGYPTRALRTQQFLYLHNFFPDRWPAGTPDHQKSTLSRAWLADCDNGPTKSYIFDNRDLDDAHRLAYQLSFGKRPAEELYDLSSDPQQLTNVATDPRYQEVRTRLKKQLWAQLKRSGDPRITGNGDELDRFPYLGGAPRFPEARKKKR